MNAPKVHIKFLKKCRDLFFNIALKSESKIVLLEMVLKTLLCAPTRRR